MLRFDKATYLSLLFKFVLSARFSRYFIILGIHKYNIHAVLYFIGFIILLYTFLVISFAQYKEYIICLISFTKVCFQMYCLLLLVQELLVVFEAFVWKLIF